MILCVVLGWSKRSGTDGHIRFFRQPRIETRKGPRYLEFGKKCGAKVSSSHSEIAENILANDRIVSGIIYQAN